MKYNGMLYFNIFIKMNLVFFSIRKTYLLIFDNFFDNFQ